MEQLKEKEEGFVDMQQELEKNHAAEQVKKEQDEALKKYSQEQQEKKKNMEKELQRQDEEYVQEAEDEKKRTDMVGQEKTRAGYGTNAMGQNQARPLAEYEEDKKHEEEKRLRDMTSFG
jgi:hypothetical protein